MRFEGFRDQSDHALPSRPGEPGESGAQDSAGERAMRRPVSVRA